MEAQARTFLRSKPGRIAIALLFAIVVVLLLAPTQIQNVYKPQQQWKPETSLELASQASSTAQPKVHILLLATKSNVKLCKTLLTLTILGYPSPHIISWGDSTEKNGFLLGGGSHFGKITRTSEYIDEHLSGPESQDDLILLLDAYDVWFQLPLDVLLARYRCIINEDNARVAHRMGRAFAQEDITSGVVFGAGKRCGPNFQYTRACYPVPESPLPMDQYGNTTDTPIGHNPWSSFRTRYLNAGTAIGPVKMMRSVLKRAQAKLAECRGRRGAEFDLGGDLGGGDSDHCYRGSDQSIWMEIFGEQEIQREVMRRHHRKWYDGFLDTIIPNRAGSWPRPTQIYGVPVLDPLEPGFVHQEADKTYTPGKPLEFGMSLDYWSQFSHQTSNAQRDAKYIRKDRPLEGQIGKRDGFDCKAKSPDWHELSDEVLSQLLPGQKEQWESLPFYTELCIGQIPVLIHHNSVHKGEIEKQWDRTWWHGRSRALLEAKRQGGAQQLHEGIPTDKPDTILKWEDLCPSENDAELFRTPSEKDVES